MGFQYILCQLSNFQTNSKIHLTSITWALKSEGISQNLAFTPVFSLFMKKHTSYSLSRTVVSEFCEASKQTVLQKLYLFLGNTNLFLYFLSPSPFCKILYHLFTKNPETEKAHMDPSCYVYWNWWKGKWEKEGVHGKMWELEWPRHRSQQMQTVLIEFLRTVFIHIDCGACSQDQSNPREKSSSQTLSFLSYQEA